MDPIITKALVNQDLIQSAATQSVNVAKVDEPATRTTLQKRLHKKSI